MSECKKLNPWPGVILRNEQSRKDNYRKLLSQIRQAHGQNGWVMELDENTEIKELKGYSTTAADNDYQCQYHSYQRNHHQHGLIIHMTPESYTQHSIA